MKWTYKIVELIRSNELHIRNISYFVATRLLAIIAFILVVPFFISQASEDQYGLASIGFSLLTIASALDIAFGYVLVQSLGRRYARRNDIGDSPTLGIFSFFTNVAFGIAFIVVAVVLASNISTEETLMYASLAALLPALCISGCVAAIFQSRNQLKPINLSRFGFEISKVFALASSAIITKDISLIGPIMLVAAYIRSGLDLHFLKKAADIKLKYRINSMRENKRYFRIARYGIHPLMTVAITLPTSIGDKIIINKLFGASAAAHYSIAFDICSKAYILVYAVNSAMLSVILHRHARRSSTRAPLMVGLYSVTVLLIFFYIPLFIFAPQIIDYWLPNEMSVYISPLVRIMAIASVAYLYANVFEVTLTAMGRAKRIFSVYLVAAISYWISILVSYWQQSLNGFMYSYLLLTIILLAGFGSILTWQRKY